MTVIAPAASGTGVSLAAYYAALGEQLGTCVAYTVSTAAAAGEATRLVLADELRDDESDAEDWGNEVWVYARSGTEAGNQRRVLKGGYQGSVGGLVLSRPWASVLAAGTTVVVSEPLPVRRHRQTKGLVTFVNEALNLCRVEARITFTGNGTHSYSLSDYPWIRSKQDIIGLRDRWALTSIDPTAWSPYGFEVNVNGATVTLEPEIAYTTGDTFELVVPVRADRLISDGSSWSYTVTPGLIADTDQAAAPQGWVVVFGMYKALQYRRRQVLKDQRLSDAMKQAALSDLAAEQHRWAIAARRIISTQLPKPHIESARGMVGLSCASPTRL